MTEYHPEVREGFYCPLCDSGNVSLIYPAYAYALCQDCGATSHPDGANGSGPAPAWPIGGNPAHPEYINDPTSRAHKNRNTAVPKHHSSAKKRKSRPTVQAITRHVGVVVTSGEEEPAPSRGEMPEQTAKQPTLFSDYLPDQAALRVRPWRSRVGSHPRGKSGVNRFR